MKTAARNLCQSIEDAFADVVYPGDHDIAFTEPPEDVLVTRELLRAYKGKHWKQILKNSNAWFRYHHSDLTAFSPGAFHFFLPAFLIKCVTSAEKLDLVPCWIVWEFMPSDSKLLSPKYRANMSRLNSKQKRVLIAFFRFLEQELDDDGFIENINSAILALKKSLNGSRKCET